MAEAEEASIVIHAPRSAHPSLADGPAGFDRQWFMGRWGVSWSTLPMWKEKRDVVIEYQPLAPDARQFQSTVYYRKRTASSDSNQSTVRGTETLSPGLNGATFDWRGSGLLFFVTSHWEVLGYGKDSQSGLEWAVTHFSKTLFTPAGVDVYVRSTTSTTDPELWKGLVDRISQVVKDSLDPIIKDLAQGGFNVPGEV